MRWKVGEFARRAGSSKALTKKRTTTNNNNNKNNNKNDRMKSPLKPKVIPATTAHAELTAVSIGGASGGIMGWFSRNRGLALVIALGLVAMGIAAGGYLLYRRHQDNEDSDDDDDDDEEDEEKPVAAAVAAASPVASMPSPADVEQYKQQLMHEAEHWAQERVKQLLHSYYQQHVAGPTAAHYQQEQQDQEKEQERSLDQEAEDDDEDDDDDSDYEDEDEEDEVEEEEEEPTPADFGAAVQGALSTLESPQE